MRFCVAGHQDNVTLETVELLPNDYSRDLNACCLVEQRTRRIHCVESFFAFVELLLIGAGIYLIHCRDKLFGYKGREGDTSAAADLRMAMLVIIWMTQ